MISIRRAVGLGVVGALAAASVALVACGGGGGDDGGSGPAIINVNQGPTQPIVKNEQIIEVKDNSFSPETVTVKAGTKVVWKWVGTANPHSIQLSGTTSDQQTSGEYTRDFERGGSTFAYQCGVHGSAMAGKITVE